MPHVAFIDESGDTGFKPGSSKHLTLAAIVTAPDLQLKDTLIRVKKAFGVSPGEEMKWAGGKRHHPRRMMLIETMMDLQIAIYAVTVVKERVWTDSRLHSDTTIMYNYPMKLLLEMLNRHAESKARTEIRIIADGRQQALDASLQSYLSLLRGRGQLSYLKPKIDFEDSSQFAGLQCVDHIAGGFHVAFEQKDMVYWQVMKKRIHDYKIFPPPE